MALVAPTVGALQKPESGAPIRGPRPNGSASQQVTHRVRTWQGRPDSIVSRFPPTRRQLRQENCRSCFWLQSVAELRSDSCEELLGLVVSIKRPEDEQAECNGDDRRCDEATTVVRHYRPRSHADPYRLNDGH